MSLIVRIKFILRNIITKMMWMLTTKLLSYFTGVQLKDWWTFSLHPTVKKISPFSLMINFLEISFSNLNCWWRWYLQDLTIKPKYLVTFTVGVDQKNNIDAAVKKVGLILFSLNLFSQFSLSHSLTLKLCYSSQRTSPLSCFTMMVGQVNGMSLNGRGELSMWVLRSKLNG